MVCDTNDRLFAFGSHQGYFILDVQDNLVVLNTRHVKHLAFHGARISKLRLLLVSIIRVTVLNFERRIILSRGFQLPLERSFVAEQA